ncbi:MAG: hypothetical protein QGD91_12810 [Actinomycetota bacterium]|nr:hypothetical protein [Actinomycetota bacterium]MDK1104387.1 hypothetical protein [Actinomycetota bacterium]
MERVAGVFTAEFDHELDAGRVTYDPEKTDPATFISELERMTGFQAVVSDETARAPR